MPFLALKQLARINPNATRNRAMPAPIATNRYKVRPKRIASPFDAVFVVVSSIMAVVAEVVVI